MKMKEISLAAFICCWFAAVAGKAIALDLYGFDVPKQYPKAYSAYKAVIPSQYKKISWMQRLDGTSGPLKDIDVEGAPSLLFWMCEPHNCGGNELAVLARKDGKRATTLFQSADHTDGKRVYFGKPSDAETTLLISALSQ